MNRIERKAPFLDDQVIAVQEGPDAWCYEPGVSGRVWCILSQRYADAIAPDGWFFLYEVQAIDTLRLAQIRTDQDQKYAAIQAGRKLLSAERQCQK